MKRFFLLLLIIVPLATAVRGGEKPNTVLIHPGEVIYAKFAENGKKLKLLATGMTADDNAQLILSMVPVPKSDAFILKLQNRFSKDLNYKVEMRILTLKVRQPATVFPVVAGKMSFDNIAPKADELAVYGFELIL